jgi:hypothetical protein
VSIRMWSRLPGILLTVVLMVSLAVGVWLDRTGPQWRSGIEMMKVLPAEVTSVEYFDFSGSFAEAFRDEVVFEGLDAFCGQDTQLIRARGRCSFQDHDDAENSPDTAERLTLYKGQFDGGAMARALEGNGEFGPAVRHGRILMWTSMHDSSHSIALIGQLIVSGPTKRVQQCVEAAQGRRESLYDNKDARDVLNRLPNGDGFFLGTGLQVSKDRPGRLAAAECSRLPTSNHASTARTIVEKYSNVDSASARMSGLEAESESHPTGFKRSQNGVFVRYTRFDRN